jgi:hypothetical protein
MLAALISVMQQAIRPASPPDDDAETLHLSERIMRQIKNAGTFLARPKERAAV